MDDDLRTGVRHWQSEVLFYHEMVRLTNHLLVVNVTHATYRPRYSQAVLGGESGRMRGSPVRRAGECKGARRRRRRFRSGHRA